MFQLEVLVLEFGAVDGAAPSAVTLGEVAALKHESEKKKRTGIRGALSEHTSFHV